MGMDALWAMAYEVEGAVTARRFVKVLLPHVAKGHAVQVVLPAQIHERGEPVVAPITAADESEPKPLIGGLAAGL